MELIYFYTDCFKNKYPFIKNICEEMGISLRMFNVDEDPAVLQDYDIHVVPPAFVIFDSAGKRRATITGRNISKERLLDTLKNID